MCLAFSLMESDDAIFFSILTLVLIGVVLWYGRKKIFTRSWPRATGTIQEGTVVTKREVIFYVIPLEIANAELSYSYTVDGEYYAGYDKKQFFDEQRAWDYVSRFKGKSASVRHSHRHPERSLLEGVIEYGAVAKAGL